MHSAIVECLLGYGSYEPVALLLMLGRRDCPACMRNQLVVYQPDCVGGGVEGEAPLQFPIHHCLDDRP